MTTEKLLQAVVSALNEIPNKALHNNKGGFQSTYDIASAINKHLKENKTIRSSPLHETIADIAYNAGLFRHYSGNSRADIQDYISLAKQFQKVYKKVDWDTTNLDYIIEVESFAKKHLKLVNKLNIVPVSPQNKYNWDNIEVSPVSVELEEIEEGKLVETDASVCEEGEEDFWSVYLHQVEGVADCIADLPTKELATNLADLLKNAVKSFHPNAKFIDDVERPNHDLIVEAVLQLAAYRNTFKKSQVGYIETSKIITELNKLLKNGNK